MENNKYTISIDPINNHQINSTGIKIRSTYITQIVYPEVDTKLLIDATNKYKKAIEKMRKYYNTITLYPKEL